MKSLKQLIIHYAQAYPEEKAPHDMLKFLDEETGYFLRNNYNGHFTGSAWIVSPDKSSILMTHHKKLGKWIQLGGHADGESDLLKVALREAKEESGIQQFKVLSEEIFDLDIHGIPQNNFELGHLHYDVRFLIEADPTGEAVIISDESHDVTWIPLADVVKINPEVSIQRMIKKTIIMKDKKTKN
jgi:8-oxo-dGTP pyrophosphatase MutT (NUDIX family)